MGGAPVFTFSSLTDKNTFACQSKVQEPQIQTDLRKSKKD